MDEKRRNEYYSFILHHSYFMPSMFSPCLSVYIFYSAMSEGVSAPLSRGDKGG